MTPLLTITPLLTPDVDEGLNKCRETGISYRPRGFGKGPDSTKPESSHFSAIHNSTVFEVDNTITIRTGKEIRFRFGSSEDKAGKEAKRRTTGW